MRGVDQSILLDVADGVPVPNEQTTTISHPLASRALEARARASSTLRCVSHPRYNCHGLTFASRRTGVFPDHLVALILRADGYKIIPRDQVLPGDVAIYYTQDQAIDHSALVVSRPDPVTKVPWVCSKWGVIGPEVLHLATECPDYALANIIYYRCDP